MSQAVFDDTATFAIRDDLVVEQVDDEFLVLDLRGNEYFGLNPVARHIWASVESGATFGDIVDLICAEFEVDRDTVVTDVTAFLSDAQEHGLVRRLDT